MNIVDLEYLNSVSQDNQLAGGLWAYADATTIAVSGFGSGSAIAVASGESTSTSSEASVWVYSNDKYSITDSFAEGSAYAQTGSHTSSFTATSQSLSLYSF